MTLVIDMQDPTSLEELYLKANLQGVGPDQLFEDPTKLVHLRGIGIEFLEYNLRLDAIERRLQLVIARLKQASCYEVIAFAATHPEHFLQVLEKGSIILPKEKDNPHTVFSQNEGVLRIDYIHHDSELRMPLYQVGTYFM